MKRKKPVSIRCGMLVRLCAGGLVVWLISMAAVTWITAFVLDQSMTQENLQETENLAYRTRVYDWAESDQELPQGTLNFWLFDGVRSFGRKDNRIGGGLLRQVQHPAQTACIIYDGQGNILEKNGNGLYFDYMTEESWLTADSDMYRDGTARALFGQSEIEELALQSLQNRGLFALRLTGHIEDGLMTPSKIEYIPYDSFIEQVFEHYPSGSYERHLLLQEFLDRGVLEWDTFLSGSSTGVEEAVYYSVNSYASYYDSGDPVEINETKYDNLMHYLETVGVNNKIGYFWSEDQGNLWDRVVCREMEVYQNPDGENPALMFRILAGIRFSPMKLAMAGLLYVYIGLFIMAALLAAILWSTVRNRLVDPICAFNMAAQEWGALSWRDAGWREIDEMEEHYSSLRWERGRLLDENKRLQVALDYAKEAEANRRQMTSAVAHELKTPLAVIHSYAEGLKEKIAEEKREQYLDVVLSETERLDGLVMEMLDLSRLEAGKVKLSRDHVLLSSLSDQILQKMEYLILEKGLEVACDYGSPCEISADENRITQVLDNFVSNAIRYTPDNGWIRVKTYEDRRHVWFRLENESEAFTEEELSKIWDTFYRTDKARSGKGTGLGLAICRRIIELHGGSCQAENIPEGVAFWFRLDK